jgi:hypothetical protein
MRNCSPAVSAARVLAMSSLAWAITRHLQNLVLGNQVLLRTLFPLILELACVDPVDAAKSLSLNSSAFSTRSCAIKHFPTGPNEPRK